MNRLQERIVSCVVVIVGVLATGATQSAPQLDYFAHAGSCELDFNRDGITDGVSIATERLAPSEYALSLDTSVRYAGSASQKVQLVRNAAGVASLRLVFPSYLTTHIPMRLNEPIRVRLAYRAQGFTNATYEIFVASGAHRVSMVAPTHATTTNWQVVEAVLPAQLNSSQAAQVFLEVRLVAGAGAATGTLWIDEARALSGVTLSRPASLPNGLRLALSHAEKESDWVRLVHNHPWQLIVGARWHRLAAFRQYAPNIPQVAYVLFTGPITDSWARHNSDLYNYDDVLQNHPDWFLLDSHQRRILYDGGYYLDLGKPQVRERARDSLMNLIPRLGFPHHVMLDNFDMRVGPNRFAPPNYPTNDLWVQAVIGWVNTVGPPVQSTYGVRFIPNIAWSPGFMLRGINGGPDAPGVTILNHMSGFWMEHVFCHGYNPGAPNRPNYTHEYGRVEDANNWRIWTVRNEIRLATEYPDKIIILNPTFDWQHPSFQQKLRFSIAMALAVQHANTYLVLDPRHPTRLHPEGFVPPEVMVPLGNPVAPMQFVQGNLLEGGLIVRQYQYGVVVVNPTHDRTYTYTVPLRGYNWDRQLVQAGTQVQLPPHTGMVFYAAPEMRVWVRASRASARPGEEVNYKVEYANDGLVAAQNVEIRVSLPDGMQLVSSTPAARVQGSELIWTIPNVPAGGRGSASFRVRVR